MKFFCGLYNSSYNYVKGCSSVVRYLHKLILKGGVKRVSLLLAISIDYDHIEFFFFFFFMHADALAELVLKRVEDIVMMSFSMKHAICIFYSKYFCLVKLQSSIFCNQKCFFFFFFYYLTAYKIQFDLIFLFLYNWIYSKYFCLFKLQSSIFANKNAFFFLISDTI